MRIAVDIDGVESDFANEANHWMSLHSDEYHPVNRRDWYKSYTDGDSLFERFWHTVSIDHTWWWNCKAIPDSGWVIRALARDHDVFFLTARDPKYRAVTEKILRSRDLGHIPLHFSTTKHDYEAGFDLLIDDYEVHVQEALDAGKVAVLFDQPWNSHSDLHRVHGWQDVLAYIKEMEEKMGNPDSQNPIPLTGEVRVTEPTTGGEKGEKPARFDLLPVGPLWEVAELYGAGAAKYAERNWEKGYSWHRSYAALQRHANLFWQGEDIDPETHKHHLASVVFHAMAMMEWGRTHPELDDRSV